METKEFIKNIVEEILADSDSKYITEIFIQNYSYNNGNYSNLIELTIETDLNFKNTTLYDCIFDLEEENYPFELRISIEPDAVERGHGIVLWKRGQGYLL